MNQTELAAEVARIAELDAKRTQGEWKERHEPPRHVIFIEATVGESALAVTAGGYHDSVDNAAFIASAPQMALLIAQLWDERAKMVDDIRVAKEALEKTQEPEPDWDAIRYALTRLKPYEKLFEKEGDVDGNEA